jgi:hypothetical protein
MPADGPERRWTDCHVIDVSAGGAALELNDPAIHPGTRLALEVREILGEVVGIVFDAEVKNIGRTEGGFRVGVEFVDVGVFERAVLRSLFGTA